MSTEPLAARPLTDKVAIVTGGGQGIGRGIARRLVELGATTVVVSRTAAAVEETREQLSGLGTVEAAPCDVSDRAAAKRLIADVRGRHGSLDILVCSHGVYNADSPFLELSEEQWDRTLGINLGGNFTLAQATARTMVADSTAGRIIFISSINGIASEPELLRLQHEQGGPPRLCEVDRVRPRPARHHGQRRRAGLGALADVGAVSERGRARRPPALQHDGPRGRAGGHRRSRRLARRPRDRATSPAPSSRSTAGRRRCCRCLRPSASDEPLELIFPDRDRARWAQVAEPLRALPR